MREQKMNELELRAYGLVAQAIANHAFAMASGSQEKFLSEYPDAPKSTNFHEFVSRFEDVAHDLVRLGILKPLDEKPGCPHFVFECDISKSNNVAEQNWRQGPAFCKTSGDFY